MVGNLSQPASTSCVIGYDGIRRDSSDLAGDRHLHASCLGTLVAPTIAPAAVPATDQAERLTRRGGVPPRGPAAAGSAHPRAAAVGQRRLRVVELRAPDLGRGAAVVEEIRRATAT
jgi:hypothetical protein